MSTAEAVSHYLAHEASEEELNRYVEVAEERRSLLATAAMATIQEGAEVTIGKLTPRYLTGLTGTVSHVEWAGKRLATIQLDEESTEAVRKHLGLSGKVIRHYLTGIPVSACSPK